MIVETLPEILLLLPHKMTDLVPVEILFPTPPAIKLISVVVVLLSPPIMVDSYTFPLNTFPDPHRIEELEISP
jgi:hypothetical protein